MLPDVLHRARLVENPPSARIGARLADGETVRVIRGWAKRTSALYTVWRVVEGWTMKKSVARVVQAPMSDVHVASCTVGGRVIIFCLMVDDVDVIANSLRKEAESIGGMQVFIFVGYMTTEQKLCVLADWRSAVGGVVVATSGFGVGVNLDDIGQGVHAGGSYSPLDYAQETGRGERNGWPTRCVLIVSPDVPVAPLFLKYVVNTSNCRRLHVQRAANEVESTSEFEAGALVPGAAFVALRPCCHPARASNRDAAAATACDVCSKGRVCDGPHFLPPFAPPSLLHRLLCHCFRNCGL
jgi:superfamily II DNA helicase RecQ